MNSLLIPIGKVALFFLIAFSDSEPIDGMTARQPFQTTREAEPIFLFEMGRKPRPSQVAVSATSRANRDTQSKKDWLRPI